MNMTCGSLDELRVNANNCTMRSGSKFRPICLALLAGSLALLSACAGVSASSKASSGSSGTSSTSGQAGQYSVDLSWNPSNSAVVGYNLYRGTQSGGPYARVNPSVLAMTSFTDSSIASGTTYYYVSTSVNADSEESAYSNEATATIP
jgi:fibronectin type 3 domain-containing protein